MAKTKIEKDTLNFKEITTLWLDSVVPNNEKFKERQYVSYKGQHFKVDGKNIKFEYKINGIRQNAFEVEVKKKRQ